jgi:hypothetical protein
MLLASRERTVLRELSAALGRPEGDIVAEIVSSGLSTLHAQLVHAAIAGDL